MLWGDSFARLQNFSLFCRLKASSSTSFVIEQVVFRDNNFLFLSFFIVCCIFFLEFLHLHSRCQFALSACFLSGLLLSFLFVFHFQMKKIVFLCLIVLVLLSVAHAFSFRDLLDTVWNLGGKSGSAKMTVKVPHQIKKSASGQKSTTQSDATIKVTKVQHRLKKRSTLSGPKTAA